MSKFAPVVPIRIAEHLQGATKEEDIFGDYHLVLAHDILKYPDDYKRVYSRVRERHPESFIILDNSIVELGTAMQLDDLMAAAAIVNPDCIVIPDAMGEGELTRQMAKEFCAQYSEYTNTNRIRNPIRLMGVLQGEDVEDCMETYRRFYGISLISHIGVPRVIAQRQGSRMPVLNRMAHVSAFNSIHLLGFSDDLLDDVSCARMPIVRGIDSAVPIRAGLQGIELTLNYPEDCGPRGDYWERSIVTDINDRDVAYNLRCVRSWINPRKV